MGSLKIVSEDEVQEVHMRNTSDSSDSGSKEDVDVEEPAPNATFVRSCMRTAARSGARMRTRTVRTRAKLADG
jgi:hypothetical protein